MVMDFLKITAKMASPVVINHDLMLDTLLITKKAVELKLDAQTLDPLKPLEVQDIVQYFGDIPLCSKAFFEGVDSKNVYYKRFDEDNEYFADTKKIKIGSGKYKNYANTLKVTDVAEIVFYAKGNKSEIERILSWVYALGKKESQGYGIIREWSVEKVDEIIDFLNPEKPLRPLPLEIFSNGFNNKNRKLVAYKFPYWYNGNKKLCYV